jgi:hypothetical protein
MLSRALHLPDGSKGIQFKDQARIPKWGISSVAAVSEAGLIAGFADNTFRPGQPITRAELAAIAVRALNLKLEPNASLSFNDSDAVPKWAIPYIAAAVKAGLFEGIGNNRFAPNEPATRAEAVTLILSLLDSKSNPKSE